MNKILLLEDEESIRSFIVVNLIRGGFHVVEAAAGQEAIRCLQEHPDITIALLDVMVPAPDGFEICRYIRERNEWMGIIFLTAKVQEKDKIVGLSLGADDYISKPFSPGELMARVHSLLRRVQLKAPHSGHGRLLRSGPFELDAELRELRKNGRQLDVTPTELALLRMLMDHAGVPLNRNRLLDEIWGQGYFGDPKMVDVNIRRLRQKIEEDPSKPVHIETVWGFGYKWKELP
ncbi:response regulator transcription factor [Paenibacillus piri]|uniref:Response regulator transcription factor n=1 Tax=Paenibacillus piri TaxID=2547395 RepID=A0A4R5KMQ7_9BACL|nr:response regulator transcription factor [Paenibacillus piri]TDF95907.1 response regulator transcription factor [Paenibacillus piri]